MDQKSKPKSKLGKIWYFIWYDNSIWSWLVNIVLAFVIIKFLVYPGLGLLLGVPFPIVAVISGSMDHGLGTGGEVCSSYPKNYKESFDNWWENCKDWYLDKGIEKNDFKTFVLRNGFSKGDIIVLKGRDPKEIEVGDIIVFSPALQTASSEPIIHRVVKKSIINGDYSFQTKGDHNPDSIQSSAINELSISSNRVIGKAWLKIPFLGYLKIWFVDIVTAIIH